MDTAVRLGGEHRRTLVHAAWEALYAASERLGEFRFWEDARVLAGGLANALWAERFGSFEALRTAGAGHWYLALLRTWEADNFEVLEMPDGRGPVRRHRVQSRRVVGGLKQHQFRCEDRHSARVKRLADPLVDQSS